MINDKFIKDILKILLKITINFSFPKTHPILIHTHLSFISHLMDSFIQPFPRASSFDQGTSLVHHCDRS